MSTTTISSLERISRDELSDLLKDRAAAGPVKAEGALQTTVTTSNSGSISSTTLTETPSLAIIDVRDSDHVGGHIFSSRHVPSTSLDYRMPELIRELADTETVVFHCALSQQRGPAAALKYIRERERLKGKADGKPKQRVLVLEGGFVEWQEKYGDDITLTEAYQKDLWV